MNAESYNKKIIKIISILLAVAFVAGIVIPSFQETSNFNWALDIFIIVVVIGGYFISGIIMARIKAEIGEADAALLENGFVLNNETTNLNSPLIKYEKQKNYIKAINKKYVTVSVLTVFPVRHSPGIQALYFKLNQPSSFGKVIITKPNAAISTYINATWMAGLSKVEFETDISRRLVLAEKNSQELWQFFDPSFLLKLEQMPTQTDLLADDSGIGLLLWDYREKFVIAVQPLLDALTAKKPI
ncbi:MAG: hypothetical protein Q7S80_00515 [bacterium]|nr:hypothetical protein [bacterium]